MTRTSLYPTSIASKVQLRGSYTDLDDDAASPDGLWMLAGPEPSGWPVVSWTAPDPATGVDRYRVSWYTGGYFVNSKIVDHVSGTTSYSTTVADLPAATYEFFVTTIGTDNEESDPVSVGTAVVS